ncbi:interleukin-13 receptor subunit alpha-1-like isoform X2 [Rana temporaria]|uniref:interleukin-13 receptor subunit alpha-1-like isoform X2 n=1 Tax=Rana temporaria TaxID=8407 RepID=UPI001AACAF00|nr:interleukin-13 receptor subunit alpha-1-like isoform X2 [Rana temporaria]
METSLCHQGLIIVLLYFVTCTASRNDVSSPDNLTFGLKGMFSLFWEWKPLSANCSYYHKEMRSLKNGQQMREKGGLPHGEYEILKLKWFDPNDKLSLYVEAACKTMTESLNRTIQLAPGDKGTAVNNFHCVWHYQEHVKCTWQPGPNTPPNTTYRIFYWTEDTSNADRLYTQAELWDLFETGTTCELFPTNNSNTVGCQFLLNRSIKDHDQIAMVVTDTSKSIKPYIYYTHANHIAKFKPPTIIEANRTSHNIYVSWKKSQDTEKVVYELLLTSANGHTESYNMTPSSMILTVLPDVTYTIKVRVKLSHIVLFDNANFIWSDWSKETILPGMDDKRLTSIIVPLIISAVIIIAAVILLVYMETLKDFICPQIPDPARIFPKDFQQWLKSDVYNVYSKPEKEEICPVFLIESQPTTKCV